MQLTTNSFNHEEVNNTILYVPGHDLFGLIDTPQRDNMSSKVSSEATSISNVNEQ